MTEKLAPNNRKIINWDEKTTEDSSRFGRRMEERTIPNEDALMIDNTVKPVKTSKKTIKGEPLNRLRKKIKEVYDDEDDEDELFFNINLLDEMHFEEQEHNRVNNIIKTNKEQQRVGKLSVIMSSAMAADAAGLKAEITSKDKQNLDNADYNLKELRRQTLKQKISDPLKLNGELKEKNLDKTLKAIKKATKILPPELLADMPADSLTDLNAESEETKLAKLILQKTGRNAPKQKLNELANRKNPPINEATSSQTNKENA